MRAIEDRGLEDVVLVIDEAFVDNGLPGEIGTGLRLVLIGVGTWSS
jgi:hypothetical protein